MNRDVCSIQEQHRRDPSVRLRPHRRHPNRAESPGARRGDQQTAEQRRVAQLLGGNSTEFCAQGVVRFFRSRVGGQLTRHMPAAVDQRAVRRAVPVVAQLRPFRAADSARASMPPSNAIRRRRWRERPPIRHRVADAACSGSCCRAESALPRWATSCGESTARSQSRREKRPSSASTPVRRWTVSSVGRRNCRGQLDLDAPRARWSAWAVPPQATPQSSHSLARRSRYSGS
jgi:hypothetical protein